MRTLGSVYCLCAVLAGSDLTAQAGPVISVTPESVVFGARSVGSANRKSVVITNTGSASLDVASITLGERTSRDIRISSGADPIVLAPSAMVRVEILYTPSERRRDTGTLLIGSDAANQTVMEVELSGFGVAGPEPQIRVNPRGLDFGEVLIDTSSSMTVEISNTGTARLDVTGIRLGPGTGPEFSASAFSTTISIAPGATVMTRVTYSPTGEGADNGTLVVESRDADEPVVTVSLTGTGVPQPIPQIQVMPTAIDYMEVFVGTPTSMSVEITNTGTAPLDIASIDLGPGTGGEFSVTGPSEPISVPQGASVTADVTYTPADEGADSGTLIIDSNDPLRPRVTISLVGVGVPVPAPQIQVTPTALDFTEVFIDSPSRLSVEIANIGTSSLEIAAIELGPETSPDFSITGFSQPISLAPGASVMTEITYTPSDEGVDSGTLVIDSNDAGQARVTVSLAGSGVPAPVPQIQVTAPLVLNYGTVFIGASSAMSVGIGNIGTAPLEISQIELGPGTSTDFSITRSGGSISLVPGASVTTGITYTPGDQGADSGTLVITSNDADQPVVTVSLVGTGVPVPVARIRVTPASLAFGEVSIETSASLPVEISNFGTAPLDVSSIELGPETSGDFAITGFDQQIVLVPDGSVLTEITYTPSDEGADSGTLVIGSDAEGNATTSVVSLTGVGVPEPMPQIEVAPLSIDYDQVQVGSRSTRSVTIRNSGMADLEVSFIGLGAGTRGEFLVTAGPESVRIPPGEEVLVEVAYAPSDEGSDSGTLRIQSDDAETPILNVSLSGAGVPAPVPQIVVTPSALTFGEVSVGSSSTLEVRIENNGTATLEVVDISLGMSTSPDFTISGGPEDASLAPGEAVVVGVTYAPTDEVADSGTVRILSDDAEDPLVTVSLFGTGRAPEPVFRRGDANEDGTIDIGDPITTIIFLFRDGPSIDCLDAADANDSGNVDLSDGIFTLSWLFNGGPVLPPPGPDNCGEDPTDDLVLCVYPLDLCGG